MIVWGAVCVNCARTVLRGAGSNWRMVEMLWHRRETRRQTEKTKPNLHHREQPAYSPDPRKLAPRHSTITTTASD